MSTFFSLDALLHLPYHQLKVTYARRRERGYIAARWAENLFFLFSLARMCSDPVQVLWCGRDNNHLNKIKSNQTNSFNSLHSTTAHFLSSGRVQRCYRDHDPGHWVALQLLGPELFALHWVGIVGLALHSLWLQFHFYLGPPLGTQATLDRYHQVVVQTIDHYHHRYYHWSCHYRNTNKDAMDKSVRLNNGRFRIRLMWRSFISWLTDRFTWNGHLFLFFTSLDSTNNRRLVNEHWPVLPAFPALSARVRLRLLRLMVVLDAAAALTILLTVFMTITYVGALFRLNSGLTGSSRQAPWTQLLLVEVPLLCVVPYLVLRNIVITQVHYCLVMGELYRSHGRELNQRLRRVHQQLEMLIVVSSKSKRRRKMSNEIASASIWHSIQYFLVEHHRIASAIHQANEQTVRASMFAFLTLHLPLNVLLLYGALFAYHHHGGGDGRSWQSQSPVQMVHFSVLCLDFCGPLLVIGQWARVSATYHQPARVWLPSILALLTQQHQPQGHNNNNQFSHLARTKLKLQHLYVRLTSGEPKVGVCMAPDHLTITYQTLFELLLLYVGLLFEMFELLMFKIGIWFVPQWYPLNENLSSHF